MNAIYIDCEWYPRGRIFLIGFKINKKKPKALWGRQLERFPIYLDRYNEHILFVFGPDISYLEKHFDVSLKPNHICINVLRMVKDLEPNRDSFKLAAIEKSLGIKRKVDKYKTDIFKIWDDWKVLDIRSQIISYNLQDVNSLEIVATHFIEKYNLKKTDLLKYQLKEVA